MESGDVANGTGGIDDAIDGTATQTSSAGHMQRSASQQMLLGQGGGEVDSPSMLIPVSAITIPSVGTVGNMHQDLLMQGQGMAMEQVGAGWFICALSTLAGWQSGCIGGQQCLISFGRDTAATAPATRSGSSWAQLQKA